MSLRLCNLRRNQQCARYIAKKQPLGIRTAVFNSDIGVDFVKPLVVGNADAVVVGFKNAALDFEALADFVSDHAASCVAH